MKGIKEISSSVCVPCYHPIRYPNSCPHCYRLLDKVVKNARHLEDIYPVIKQLGGRHGTRGYDVPMKHIHVSLSFILL